MAYVRSVALWATWASDLMGRGGSPRRSPPAIWVERFLRRSIVVPIGASRSPVWLCRWPPPLPMYGRLYG